MNKVYFARPNHAMNIKRREGFKAAGLENFIGPKAPFWIVASNETGALTGGHVIEFDFPMSLEDAQELSNAMNERSAA